MNTKILLGLAILWPLASWAADPLDIKPGLWENSTTISGMPAMPAMPQIPESALAQMPPQQRAQVEAMMKGRGGAGAPQTVKFCVTREAIDRGALGQTDKSCTSKVVSSSSTKQVMHVECTHGNATTTGDVTVDRIDPEHVKGAMAMKSSEGGRGMDVNMSFDMKYLGADCGDVKPPAVK